MRKFLHLFLSLVLSTSPAFAQVNSDGTNSSSDYGPNFLVNGDFYRSVLVGTSSRTNVNLTSGTFATTGFNLGLKHLVVSQGTNAASSFALDIDFAKLNDGYTKTNKQCALRFDYFLDEVGTGTWQTHVGTSTSVASSSIISLTPTYNSLLGGDQKAGTVLLPFPCSKLLTDKVWIYKAAGGSRAFNLGRAYVTYEKGPLGYIQPPNTFTANISSAGVKSDENIPGWIASISGTSTISITFQAGLFNSAPYCSFTSKQGNFAGTASSLTSTGITYGPSQNSTPNNVAVNHTISCTKTGADYSVPALTVQDVGFTDKNLGVFVFGAVTTPPTKGTTSEDKWMCDRNGGKLSCRGTYRQTASGSPGSGHYLISLPGGLQADTTKVTPSSNIGLNTTSGISRIGTCGGSNQADSTLNGTGTLFLYSANQMFCYITQSATPTSNNPMGSAYYGLGNNTLAMTFIIESLPIQGWGPVTAPPIAGLVGSSNLNVSHRFEYGSFGGATVRNSNCAANSTCTKWSDSAGGTIVTSDTGPTFTVTFAKPFGRPPDCQCSCVQHGVSARACNQLTSSVGATSLQCNNGQGVVYPGGVSYQCSGPAN